jgi:hypothetical protein
MKNCTKPCWEFTEEHYCLIEKVAHKKEGVNTLGLGCPGSSLIGARSMLDKNVFRKMPWNGEKARIFAGGNRIVRSTQNLHRQVQAIMDFPNVLLSCNTDTGRITKTRFLMNN